MYKVIFDLNTYQKLRLYAKKSDDEISGLGQVEKDDFSKTFYVHDIFLLKQTNGTANTIISKEAIAKFMDELLQKNKSPADYKCWWHSHADMEVGWSGLDEETINDFDIESPSNNWWLSVLTNRKGEIVCRLDVFAPVRFTIDLPWEIEVDNSQLAQSVVQEIEQNVKKTKFPDFAGMEWNYQKQKWVKIKKGKKKKKHQQVNSFNFHRHNTGDNHNIPKLGKGRR